MQRRKTVPSYRLHKQSGQAIVTLVDPLGRRRDVLLGRYCTPESRAEYARVIAEWVANGRYLPRTSSGCTDPTVNELILRFWSFVREHYLDPDGNPSSEVENYRYSLRPARELYGSTLAREFGPLALKAVRQRMVDAGLSRGLINQRVGRIKRMFKWAVSEELVPPTVYQGLQAVAGLQRGRSKATEREPVAPVPDGRVEAVLHHVNRHVRAMMRVQRLTGMRPGEVCRISRADIDQSGPVWLYTPKHHKTAWRGKLRVVGIGPQAQAVLRAFFTDDPADYLFSPRRMMAEFRAAQRVAREATGKSPRVCQRKACPRRRPGERYSTRSYAQAIAKGCRKARVPRWHPNQIRHTFATFVRCAYGLDTSRQQRK